MPGSCTPSALPEPLSVVAIAFPPDSHGGKWASHYVTKEFDGLEPSLGGYPTPLDVGYPWEYPAPFFGQPGGGSPFHCPLDAPTTTDISRCPRVVTSSDGDSEGPGHIPVEAATAALVHAHRTCEPGLSRWFATSCRVPPDELLRQLRKLYPRAQHPDWSHYPAYSYNASGGTQSYPYMVDEYRSPALNQAGAGSPHWCASTYQGWADFCPYHANGQYVHAHLIFAAVQQFLAHEHNGALCGAKWDDSNYPMKPDTSIAFPQMVRSGVGHVPSASAAGRHDGSRLGFRGFKEPRRGGATRTSTLAVTAPRPDFPYQWPGESGRKRKAPRLPFVTRLVMGSRSSS